jgi:DNA-binding SARP family transcriptional activator
MPQLQIHLFGEMQAIWSDGQALRLPPSTQSLFAYLILHHKRSHTRESLTDLFWDDMPYKNARRCLSTTLWRLKKEMPQGDSCLIVSDTGTVQFAHTNRQWIDILSFEEKANAGLQMPLEQMSPEDGRLLEEAISLYRGDLLDGYYDEWVLRERERLHLLYLRSLSRLMRYYGGQKQLIKGIAYGQQLLAVDPLREQIHRELMLLHMKKGERSLAIKQYELCRYVLADELGITPMQETQLLYKRLLSQGEWGETAVSTTAGAPIPTIADRTDKEGIAQALQQIEQAMAGLEQARAFLRSL